ncbi:Transcription factor AP-2 gamma [Globodera pallida]|nr:Transcription factor AP-2 gamma [Globodera pallida]
MPQQEPIPLPWVPQLCPAAVEDKNSSNSSTSSQTDEQQTAGKKRATDKEENLTAKSSGKRPKAAMVNTFNNNSNKNNDENVADNPELRTDNATDDDDDDDDDSAVELLSEQIIIQSPVQRVGLPMAHSIPMLAGPSRTAFALKQSTTTTTTNGAAAAQPRRTATVMAPSPVLHGGHFYPYPPAMEPAHMFPTPCNPPGLVWYNLWMRWAQSAAPVDGLSGFPSPSFFGMKMEPTESLDGKSAALASAAKTASSVKNGNAKVVDQHQRTDEDSGMGSDETIPWMAPQNFLSYHFSVHDNGGINEQHLCRDLPRHRCAAPKRRTKTVDDCSVNSFMFVCHSIGVKKTYGVELAAGRRKQGALTCFSSLVEEEAAQASQCAGTTTGNGTMALDFQTICERAYPTQTAASSALANAAMNRLELFYASKFIKRILDLHKADKSPTSELPKLEPQHFDDLHPQLQSALTNFSLMTHGFGGLAIQAVLETMIRVINECNGVLNRNYQSTAGQMAAPSDTFNP